MSDVANRPGHIQFDRGEGQMYTGCKYTGFDDVSLMNTFFEVNPGYLVVDISPLPNGQVYVLYTSVLTADQMSDLQEWGRQVDQFMSERKAARDEAKNSAEAAALKAEAERARLAELGRKCEQNHKKDFDAAREAKKGKK
jgi:hypothetical protein